MEALYILLLTALQLRYFVTERFAKGRFVEDSSGWYTDIRRGFHCWGSLLSEVPLYIHARVGLRGKKGL